MEYQYAQLPKTISFKSINDSVLSSGTYRFVKFEKGIVTKKLRSLLTTKLGKSHLGQEVGSSAYINASTHYFVRTQSLTETAFIMEVKDALPILPQEFKGKGIKSGDIIISKDGNIGEICIADKDYPNYMLSGALYVLPIIDKYKYSLLSR